MAETTDPWAAVSVPIEPEKAAPPFPHPQLQVLPRKDSGAGKPDPWAEFSVATPRTTGGQRADALVKRAAGAAAEAAPIIPFTVAGAQAGAIVGAPGGPIGIAAGTLIGGGIGAFTGMRLGQQMSRDLETLGLAVSDINNLPPDLRPFGAAGEVLGGSAVFMGAPMAAAAQGFRMAPTFAGNFLNRIIETAGKRSVITAEVSAATASAVVGGVAEDIAPGETGVRIGAEIAGGFFNPTRLVASFTTRTGSLVKNSIMRMGDRGRKTRAGQLLREFLENGGEDPEALARMLRETTDPELLAATAAQRTGSPRLAAFEAELSEINRQFGAQAGRRAKESLEAMNTAIQLLRGTGDPQALQTAAQLRGEQFRLLLNGHLKDAERQVAEAAQAITQDTPAARAALSRTAEEVIGRSLERARGVEDELWGRIPVDMAAGADGVLARFSMLRGQMLPRETVPEVIQGTINDLATAQRLVLRAASGVEVEPTALAAAQEMLTVGFMAKLRSRSLKLAQVASGKGEFNEARMFGEIAEAVLDDLTRAGAATRGGTETAFDQARTFSRELNDVYTRSFAGASRATNRSGAERIPPEVMMRRALATGDELGALRLRELEDAAGFLPARGFGDDAAQGDVELMMDVQERTLRLAAAQTIDPLSGQASPTRLAKFINDAGELLERFPGIRQSLQRAVDTGRGLSVVQRQKQRAEKFLQNKAVVSRVLKTESPADAVRGALKSDRPRENLSAMARLARREGPAAVDGLRSAIWDDALRSATNAQGKLSLRDFISALDDPIRPGLPSLITTMAQERIVPLTVVANLRKLVSNAQKVSKAIETNAVGEQILDAEDQATDLLLRVAGARIGSMVAGGSTGTSLIAAQRGSMASRSLFARIPGVKLQQVLADALKGEPIPGSTERFSLLATLLEDSTSPSRGIALAQQVHAYAVQAGLTAFTDGDLPAVQETAEPALEAALESVPAEAALAPEPIIDPATGEDMSEIEDTVETLRAELTSSEGRRADVYTDTEGNRTVGIGFNLEREDAPELLAIVGADFDAVISGAVDLTDNQVDDLLEITLDEAMTAVEAVVPSIDTLTIDRRKVLIDMAFQLGQSGLAGFEDMLKAIEDEDWETAATELLDSEYAKKQTPARAQRNAGRIRGLTE